MSHEGHEATEGTQSIERAVTLLRVLAGRSRVGWTLGELAQAAGLKKATAHRILARLERERLVHRRAAGEHYFLGPLLGELSLCIPGFHDFVAQARGLVVALARKLSLVAVLSLRSGDRFVVGARVESPRLRSKLNAEGSYRPLFSTAGGIAILITLTQAEQQRIVEANTRQLASRGAAQLDHCHAMWRRSRELGFGCNFGDIAAGTNAVAVPIVGGEVGAFASLTLAGPDNQLEVQRCHELVPLLRAEAEHLAQLAVQVHPGLYASAAAGGAHRSAI